MSNSRINVAVPAVIVKVPGAVSDIVIEFSSQETSVSMLGVAGRLATGGSRAHFSMMICLIADFTDTSSKMIIGTVLFAMVNQSLASSRNLRRLSDTPTSTVSVGKSSWVGSSSQPFLGRNVGEWKVVAPSRRRSCAETPIVEARITIMAPNSPMAAS